MLEVATKRVSRIVYRYMPCLHKLGFTCIIQKHMETDVEGSRYSTFCILYHLAVYTTFGISLLLTVMESAPTTSQPLRSGQQKKQTDRTKQKLSIAVSYKEHWVTSSALPIGT